jgi:CubicO group peptidase (beta-lactamase class C family)
MALLPSRTGKIPSLTVSGSVPLELDVLADWLDEIYSRQAFNGTVLIAQGGKICFERHCGFTDIDGRIPLSNHSSYSLASASKPFTALGIMLLVRNGTLALHDKLAKYIPELSTYGEITIKQMLHHTSGIPDHIELADETWDTSIILTMTDLIALFQKYRPRRYFAPGDQFEYSNTGYVFLAEIITRASGTPYPEFMAEEILKPLGMNDSAAFNLASKECPLRSRVFGFRKSFGRKVRCDLNFLDGVFGDGGIFASAEDLVRWDCGLRDGTLIPRDTYEEAYVAGKLNNGETTGYGFGWEIEPSNVVAHWGGWEGFTSYVRRDLKKHTLLVVLSNLGPSSEVDPICSELKAFVEGISGSQETI